MATKIIKTIAFIFMLNGAFAQKTKLDTLKMFEGHWVFKMAMNTDYTAKELEETYLKHVRGNKIHIQGTRIYGNFDEGGYENYFFNELKYLKTFSNENFKYEDFNQKDYEELKNLKLNTNQNEFLYITTPQMVSVIFMQH